VLFKRSYYTLMLT